MIQLTRDNIINNKVWIDPTHITTIEEMVIVDKNVPPDYTGKTMIISSAAVIIVTESPETVARLIIEYKQRQMRLQAAYAVLYADYKHTIVDKVVVLESEDRG